MSYKIKNKFSKQNKLCFLSRKIKSKISLQNTSHLWTRNGPETFKQGLLMFFNSHFKKTDISKHITLENHKYLSNTNTS